ncbi:MAG: hypothetical protein LBS64_05000 [Spirochaetaceae bacterium]|nr:hypothetical protein [Spirochaetaceae bacterium]
MDNAGGKKVFFLSFVVLLLWCGTGVFALSTITGFSEFNYALQPEDHSMANPPGELEFPSKVSVFFDGQVDLVDFLFIRTAFSANGRNVSGNFDTTDAAFRNDELSFTFHYPMWSQFHFFSVFVGQFEAIGTDVFLKKYFGTDAISSKLLQNRVYPNGIPLYSAPGLGAAYHVKFRAPLAAALGFSMPSATNASAMNAYVRLAGVSTMTSFDIALGMFTRSNPASIGIQGGATFIVGSPYGQSLFLQAGVKNFPTAGTFDMNNIYVVLEPRFVISNLNFDLTFFALPRDEIDYDNLLFVSFANQRSENGPLLGAAGIGLSLYNQNFFIGNLKSKLGLAVVGGLDNGIGAVVSPAADYTMADHMHAQISPFLGINLQNGVISMMLSIDPLNKTKIANPPQTDIVSSIRLHFGYLVHY